MEEDVEPKSDDTKETKQICIDNNKKIDEIKSKSDEKAIKKRGVLPTRDVNEEAGIISADEEDEEENYDDDEDDDVEGEDEEEENESIQEIIEESSEERINDEKIEEKKDDSIVNPTPVIFTANNGKIIEEKSCLVIHSTQQDKELLVNKISTILKFNLIEKENVNNVDESLHNGINKGEVDSITTKFNASTQEGKGYFNSN
jgi:hypothetical protein